MDVSVVSIICSLVLSLLCVGAVLLFLVVLLVGVVLLRRRGSKVTVKGAVSVGAESVSQVFMRTKGGLADMDDDDDDDDDDDV